MKIARELSPTDTDFSFYFDTDTFTNNDIENNAVYIVNNTFSYLNQEEYKKICGEIRKVADDVSGWLIGFKEKLSISEQLSQNELFTQWAQVTGTENLDPHNPDIVAEYLTIKTGKPWSVQHFQGAVQGAFCDVVYCTTNHSPVVIKEIGEFWVGLGHEFVIDEERGYYVTNDVYANDERLRGYLAICAGCSPDELEVYLYDGEHVVTEYKKLIRKED